MGKPKTERGERLRVLEQVRCKEGVEVMKVEESLMGTKMYVQHNHRRSTALPAPRTQFNPPFPARWPANS